MLAVAHTEEEEKYGKRTSLLTKTVKMHAETRAKRHAKRHAAKRYGSEGVIQYFACSLRIAMGFTGTGSEEEIHVYLRVFMCIYLRVFTRIYAHLRVCTCMYVYVRAFTCL